jgi:hypothetical protein
MLLHAPEGLVRIVPMQGMWKRRLHGSKSGGGLSVKEQTVAGALSMYD